MFSYIKKYQIHISATLLVIFYTVGIVGILTSQNPVDFLSLTPLNLLISLVLLFVNHQNGKAVHWFVFLIIAFLGYFIEVLGVNTGLIFGEYAYGKTLGWKLFNTPLMIGVNWILLTYSVVYTISKKNQNKIALAFLSALILVGLDFLIEPVAIAYDFWTWTATDIPIQNYLAWYGIAFVFSYLLIHFKRESKNSFAPYLLLIQFIFFGILNFVIWK